MPTRPGPDSPVRDPDSTALPADAPHAPQPDSEEAPLTVYPLGVLLQAPLSTLDESLENPAAISRALDSIRARILSFQKNLAAVEATMDAQDPLGKGPFSPGDSLPDSFGFRKLPEPFATDSAALLQRMDQRVAPYRARGRHSADAQRRLARTLLPVLQSFISSIDHLDEESLNPHISETLCWGIRRTRDALITLFNEAWLCIHQPKNPFTQRYVEAHAQLKQAPHSLSNRLRALLILLDVTPSSFSIHRLGLFHTAITRIVGGKARVGYKSLPALEAELPPAWQYFLFEGGSLPMDPDFCASTKAQVPDLRLNNSTGLARRKSRTQRHEALRRTFEANPSPRGHRLGLLWLETGLTQEAFGRRAAGLSEAYFRKFISLKREMSDLILHRLSVSLSPAAFAYLMGEHEPRPSSEEIFSSP